MPKGYEYFYYTLSEQPLEEKGDRVTKGRKFKQTHVNSQKHARWHPLKAPNDMLGIFSMNKGAKF